MEALYDALDVEAYIGRDTFVALKIHFGEKHREEDFRWISFDIPADLEVLGYRRSLRQVLLNLLINGAETSDHRSIIRYIPVSVELDKIISDFVNIV